eukprot:1733843-Rhodomonas_salina.3
MLLPGPLQWKAGKNDNVHFDAGWQPGELRYWHSMWAQRMVISAYAIPGTVILYVATSLRACHAMSGTDTSYHVSGDDRLVGASGTLCAAPGTTLSAYARAT